jgi:6-phosphogluconolactonase/glucosamine-6-phosphate isomerase/deaminase
MKNQIRDAIAFQALECELFYWESGTDGHDCFFISQTSALQENHRLAVSNPFSSTEKRFVKRLHILLQSCQRNLVSSDGQDKNKR